MVSRPRSALLTHTHACTHMHAHCTWPEKGQENSRKTRARPLGCIEPVEIRVHASVRWLPQIRTAAADAGRLSRWWLRYCRLHSVGVDAFCLVRLRAHTICRCVPAAPARLMITYQKLRVHVWHRNLSGNSVPPCVCVCVCESVCAFARVCFDKFRVIFTTSCSLNRAGFNYAESNFLEELTRVRLEQWPYGCQQRQQQSQQPQQPNPSRVSDRERFLKLHECKSSNRPRVYITRSDRRAPIEM